MCFCSLTISISQRSAQHGQMLVLHVQGNPTISAVSSMQMGHSGKVPPAMRWKFPDVTSSLHMGHFCLNPNIGEDAGVYSLHSPPLSNASDIVSHVKHVPLYSIFALHLKLAEWINFQPRPSQRCGG